MALPKHVLKEFLRKLYDEEVIFVDLPDLEQDQETEEVAIQILKESTDCALYDNFKIVSLKWVLILTHEQRL